MSDDKRPPFRSWVEDYLAAPVPLNRAALLSANKRRGNTARRAAMQDNATGKNAIIRQDVSGARLVIAEVEEAERRASDPVERALTYLRGRGYAPVCKESTLGTGKGFRIGGKRNVTGAGAIALAERLGLKTKE